jgi:hypothetical protein
MTQKAFISMLNRRGFSYKIKGDKIIVTHGGHIVFKKLTALPPNVHFNNTGEINLPLLMELPSGIEFNTGGTIRLPSLTELPSDVVFDNATGYIFLDSVTKLPSSVVFDNARYIGLDSLTELPYGYKFNSVNGSVSLNSLTELRPDIEFNNINGILDLNAIRELSHPRKFRNQTIKLRSLEMIHHGVEFNVIKFGIHSQIQAGNLSSDNNRCRQICMVSTVNWWSGDIPEISRLSLFNNMIKQGVFER